MLELRTKNETNKNPNDLRYRSKAFALAIIQFVKQFPTSKIYLIFLDQLVRSATSIGANIIEAKASSSRKDFIHYYAIALKSAYETKYWLELLKDSKLITSNTLAYLIDELTQLCKMLSSSILTLKRKTEI